jgi:hypothetical protein
VSPRRVVDLVFGLIFIASAAAQYNDPDLVPWIAIYVFAAVGCASPLSARWASPLTVAVAGIAGIWALLILPEAMQVTEIGDVLAAMNPDRPETEAARELGGLVLVLTWAVTRMVLGGRRPRDGD